MQGPRLLAALLLAALAVTGCGRDTPATDVQRPALVAPQRAAPANLDLPERATKNTTRVPGDDPIELAAGVVRAVFPGPQRRPDAVTLVDSGDWRAAIAASALMAAPFHAPLLYSDGTDLPAATRDALRALSPEGSDAAGKGQVIRIGNVAKPPGFETSDVAGKDSFALARSIAALIASAKPGKNPDVVIASGDNPAFAAPAAGYAAKSGDPVLFVTKDTVPPETRAALTALGKSGKPDIYVLGPSSVISPKVTKLLRRLGTVERYGGQEPVANSIEAATYLDGTFGWGIGKPGHGLVFVRADRPLDAAAASPLSGAGSYGPGLLLDDRSKLAEVMQEYLLLLQPGYRTNPVAATYNHGWIIGDTNAISVDQQVRLDALLEATRERTPDIPQPTTP
ncbi:MAG: cell wall-binding repeat-containing protein [Solirubrobacteraceae bacterium]